MTKKCWLMKDTNGNTWKNIILTHQKPRKSTMESNKDNEKHHTVHFLKSSSKGNTDA